MVQYTKPDLKKLYELLCHKITPDLHHTEFPGRLIAENKFDPDLFFPDLEREYELTREIEPHFLREPPKYGKRVRAIQNAFGMDFKKLPLKINARNKAVKTIIKWRLESGK